MAEEVSLPYAIPPLAKIAPVDAVANPPLSPEHLWQIAEARKSSKKIRRAVSVARFDGWTLALAAGRVARLQRLLPIVNVSEGAVRRLGHAGHLPSLAAGAVRFW